MPQTNPFYFIHVPKCAGTSIRAHLLRYFKSDRVVDSWNREDAFMVSAEKLRDAELVMSHSGTIFSGMMNRNSDFLTVFREPFDLFKARCREIRRDKFHVLNEKMRNMDLPTFIRTESFIESTANIVTRHLQANSISLYSLLEEDRRYINLEDRNHHLENNFSNTIRFIDGAKYKCTINEINSCISRVAADRGFVYGGDIYRNVSEIGREDADQIEQFADEFYERNKLDLKIWEHVKSEPRTVAPAAEARKTIQFSYTENTDIDLSGPSLAQGWHLPETLEEGKFACWTLDKYATVYLPSKMAIRSIRCIFQVHATSVFEELKILYNGVAISFEINKNTTSIMHEFFFSIDLSNATHESMNILTFDNIHPVIPYNSGLSEDTRILGMHFTSISIFY